jgi:hypothetical protein
MVSLSLFFCVLHISTTILLFLLYALTHMKNLAANVLLAAGRFFFYSASITEK